MTAARAASLQRSDRHRRLPGAKTLPIPAQFLAMQVAPLEYERQTIGREAAANAVAVADVAYGGDANELEHDPSTLYPAEPTLGGGAESRAILRVEWHRCTRRLFLADVAARTGAMIPKVRGDQTTRAYRHDAPLHRGGGIEGARQEERSQSADEEYEGDWIAVRAQKRRPEADQTDHERHADEQHLEALGNEGAEDTSARNRPSPDVGATRSYSERGIR